ncbi:zf-HC2 domain-containing protein [Paramagnetospirillum magneticum]|uniref:zf-HC2 domain-containing protein n=1 Tax=Paramagnetospirillum magneticum TaxID=84159 RepID=UPI0002F7BC5E|nr:zf-HC2 domain-containing protein [Paramagnetospirillum magneticum]
MTREDLHALIDRLLGATDASAAGDAEYARRAAHLADLLDRAGEVDFAGDADASAALLAAYLDGGLTPEEAAALEARLAQSRALILEADASQGFVEAVVQQAQPIPQDLLASIIAPVPVPESGPKKRSTWTWWLPGLALAAAAAVLAGLLITRSPSVPTDAKAPMMAAPQPAQEERPAQVAAPQSTTEAPKTVPVGNDTVIPEAKSPPPRVVPMDSVEPMPPPRRH